MIFCLIWYKPPSNMGQKLVMKCLPGIAQTLDQGEELRNKILSAISVKKDITVISDCSQL